MRTNGLSPKHLGHSPTSENLNGPLTYIYKPLQSAQHTRLLRVPASSITPAGQSLDSQSKLSDQEQYELVHVSLATCRIPYQAVSYVWGNNTRDHSIKINGQRSLPITKTLATALPQLIDICSTSYLWIDQICIDQSNDQERGQQVSIMGEIFSNATEVLIWTGGELDGLSEMKTQLARPDGLNWSHIETLVELHCRPWFSRGWTVQEAVLAKKATLIAGTSLLPLEDVEQAWRKKNNLYSKDQLDRSEIGRRSLEVIMALRKRVSAPLLDSGFDGVLNSLGNIQTSDPRDHVYAFLGIKQDPRIIIRPDYNASTSEVFSDAARAIIEGTGSLSCFRFLPLSQRPESFALPSWVPDWSRNNNAGGIVQDPALESSLGHKPFKAAKEFRHKLRTSTSPVDILLVSGHIIDFVELRIPSLWRLVRDTIYRKPEEAVATPPRFFSLTDEQIVNIDSGALTDVTQNLRKRLMSVLVAGRIDVEEILTKYEKGHQDDPHSDEGLSLSFQLYNLSHHEVWITRSKKLALIPPTRCEKGDMLAIVHGSITPLLLRNSGNGNYSMGGQCYLENAMFGEAVTWEEDQADILPLA
ncbi:heterokaryon incompatibility protein-domain-containing protein [Paraphoma chrysanthemicola]|uniref:Heterokaryon incompatibility protein-domain-containing protein n=1 Tax=Paraphoma chrysanthemicola TaxID=798071 RepID=A0A8K0QWK6_9PLEO|nr:heterokaryon incompatibility protein-domain-containing protein [Paraphoma chrysanthemicola]